MARWQLIVLVSLLALVVAGCANVRRGVAWPDIDLVTINDTSRVLVTYNERVVAIDPINGQPHVLRDANDDVVRDSNGDVRDWNVEVKHGNNETFFVSPFVSDDAFIFPTYDDRFLSIDIETAELANEEGIPLTDGVIADVVVTDDLIYVPYRLRDVVALDSQTYEEVWRFETEGGIWSTPLLVDDVLYVTSLNHYLYAIDAITGDAVWAEPVDLEGAVTSTPLFHNGFLYVGSYSHKMYQVNLDGVIVYEYEGNSWIWGTPVIQDDVLYFADLNGYVYALDANNFSEIWSERPSNKGIRPAPLVTEEYVVVAARDGTVYWLNRETGLTVQDSQIEGKPELLSDILYLPADEETGRPELMLVASTDNKRLVSAFNMETFSLQWVYQR